MRNWGFVIIIIVLVGAVGVLVGSRYAVAPEMGDDAIVTDDGGSGIGDTGRVPADDDGTVPADDGGADTGADDAGTGTEDEGDSNVACAEDVKVCPDGTAVGRVAPSCEFAECPAVEVVECTPEQRQGAQCTQVYQPVCASVTVVCIVPPCPPVQETRSNSCIACMDPNVQSYTEGACEG